MDTYCVNKQAQDKSNDHEVHNLDVNCSRLPNPANQQNLGEHASCESAVRAAEAYFDDVNGCFYCANACHTT